MLHKILFTPIYSLSQDVFIKNLALFLSYPLTYAILGALLVWSIFYTKRKIYSFSLLFLTGISAWFVAHAIKAMFKVPRPFVELHFTPAHFEPGFSFPSEHATVLTALAFAMILLDKKYGATLLFLAIIVGVSRVVLGVHYPIDVLGGIWLGYLVYIPYKKLFEKL